VKKRERKKHLIGTSVYGAIRRKNWERWEERSGSKVEGTVFVNSPSLKEKRRDRRSSERKLIEKI